MVKLAQAALETPSRVGGVADEALHLHLTELAGVDSGEAAAETLHPGDANRVPARLDDRRLPLEDLDPRSLEALADTVRVAGVVIVVAKYGDDRDVTTDSSSIRQSTSSSLPTWSGPRR